MNHVDLFSGIGGFSYAARQVWGSELKDIGHSEVDKNACKIYHHHYPESECLGDIDEIEKVEADLITAGFPCQDLSVAGKREGLAGERSGLFWRLARIIGLSKPRWFVIENVPGLLSSNGGKDFWLVITTLEQFGYCVSWRIFDAQYFGVAQRRRRVWIVGSLGNIGAAKVLSKSQSGNGDDTKKQKMGERGLCISTRDGERQDPTNKTLIACTVGTIDGSNGTKGGGTNLVAQTIGTGQRGVAGRVWQDTHIAEINPDRKGETDGLSRRLDGRLSDGVRGKALGNAIVPAVAVSIFKAIKEYDKSYAELKSSGKEPGRKFKIHKNINPIIPDDINKRRINMEQLNNIDSILSSMYDKIKTALAQERDFTGFCVCIDCGRAQGTCSCIDGKRVKLMNNVWNNVFTAITHDTDNR